MLPNDVKEASRLIEWGLHPRTLPEAHPEYRDLVRRWMDDGAFKAIVASVAEGLRLRVVGVSARTGIVLGTEAESVFGYTISRFRRHVSHEDAAVVALVLVAACATFYPAQDALDSDEIMSPSATLSEIRDRLSKLCQSLESQDRTGDAVAGRWRKGWQYIRALPEIVEDARRTARSHLHGLVGLVLNHLFETGFVAVDERQDGNHLYVATPRFRMMLAEHAAVPLLDIARAAKEAVDA
ncbi:hypothetical protein JJC00_06570 [Bradyrhizobium diazoefficiens]|uniref:hypothetical protein n=1 Tax=Bradyrhizobium diazoefficiens TaxID=1355477 RepID=UPI00190DE4A0|nr:hypothetical protein [Bradyrhizobium diazoefficiens]QQO35343.1 hypothetical protein JJC00_06570 [Bradyrhizobium diazoefficiens]